MTDPGTQRWPMIGPPTDQALQHHGWQRQPEAPATSERLFTGAEVRRAVAAALTADRMRREILQAAGASPGAAAPRRTAPWRALTAGIAVLTQQVTGAPVTTSQLLDGSDPELVLRVLAHLVICWLRAAEPEHVITGMLASIGEMAASEQARISREGER